MDLAQTLYVEETGIKDGPTVVFLPGLGGTTHYWQGRLGSLEQNCHILLVDTLGFGQSPKPWVKYSAEQHIEALYRTLSQQAPFTLVGHYMGTVLAIAYAARYPAQVERLILFSVPYFGTREQTYQHFHHGTLLDRWFLTNMALAALICIMTRRLLGWLLPYVLRDMPPEVAKDLVKHTWRSFTSSLWEVIYNYDPKQDVAKLSRHLPVLCIHGEQDRTAPIEGVYQLALGQPNWEILALPKADHHPLLRNPDVCFQAIETTLACRQNAHE